MNYDVNKGYWTLDYGRPSFVISPDGPVEIPDTFVWVPPGLTKDEAVQAARAEVWGDEEQARFNAEMDAEEDAEVEDACATMNLEDSWDVWAEWNTEEDGQ